MTKTILFSIILLFVAILISIFPDIHRITITPPDTTFPLIHNYPEDYFTYLSYMREGHEGKWLVNPRYNTEYSTPHLIYTFFTFLGHVSRATNLSLPITYFLSRIILAIILYILLLYLCKILFNKNKYILISFTLILFSTGFWSINLPKDSKPDLFTLLPVSQALSFWTHFDPILRTTFLPHHLLSLILGIASLLLFVKSIEQQSFPKLLSSSILSLLSTFIFYQGMANLLAGVFIGLFMIFFKKLIYLRIKKINIKTSINLKTAFFYFLFYALFTSLSLLYLLYIQTHVFPWTNAKNIGIRFMFYIPLFDYIKALGPTFILTLIGLPLIFRKESTLLYILLGWIIVPFIGLYLLVPIFPHFGNTAFLEATSYIPLAILSIYGLKTIESFLKNKAIIIALYFLLFLYFIPPIITSVQKELILYPVSYYNRYIPNDILLGMDWLDKNTPSESVVLSGGFFGNIIPAFAHNRVVYGDEELTYNSVLKHTDMLSFFSQNDSQKAAMILKKYNVSYVFYSMDTDPPKKEFLDSLPLAKTFANSKVKIFKVD